MPFYPGKDKDNGYDVRHFKDHIRFLEILGGRDGGAGVITPLLFHGAVNYFEELPHYGSFELAKFEKRVEQWKKQKIKI